MTDSSNQKCMLCSAEDLRFVSKLRDDDNYFVMECRSCGHVQISPLPTVEEEVEYYQKNEMSRRLIPKNQLDDVKMMLKYEIWADEQCRIVTEKITPEIKILEVGSGYGWFVEKMRNLGYSIDGIELSDEKRQMAYDRAGIDLLSCNLLDDVLPSEMLEKYDLICMFYVLEHILDPFLFIKRVLPALKPTGKLFIVVPNFFDQLKQISKPFNEFSYFRAHLSYFKPETLRSFLEKIGLIDIQIEGCQLYSLENAIHWARTGVPFLERSQVDMPQGLEWIGDLYKRTVEKELASDGLIAIGTKPV